MVKRLGVPVVFLIILVVAAMVLISTHGDKSSSSNSLLDQYAVDETIPQVNLTDADGKTVALDTLGQQPTLLTFWSTGCSECKQALTDQQTFAKNNSKVNLAFVNYYGSVVDAQKKLGEYGITQPTYFDASGDAFNALSASMPSTYLLKDGQILYYFPGRIGSDILAQLLNQF
ncbi:MAG TPA: TlpA disulfide reductase family protein [Candidatus Saccharimonadales bacterium]|nr:TlpA disulfide reductase family protein [Candidatus Saccharimonadales bacterium]